LLWTVYLIGSVSSFCPLTPFYWYWIGLHDEYERLIR